MWVVPLVSIYIFSPTVLKMLSIPAEFKWHMNALQPASDSPYWDLDCWCWWCKILAVACFSCITDSFLCTCRKNGKTTSQQKTIIIWFDSAHLKSNLLVCSTCVYLHWTVSFPLLWFDPAGFVRNLESEKMPFWPLVAYQCWTSYVKVAEEWNPIGMLTLMRMAVGGPSKETLRTQLISSANQTVCQCHPCHG